MYTKAGWIHDHNARSQYWGSANLGKSNFEGDSQVFVTVLVNDFKDVRHDFTIQNHNDDIIEWFLRFKEFSVTHVI